MASPSPSPSSSGFLIISSLFLIVASSVLFLSTEAQTTPPLVEGLSFSFYNSTCANLETIIRDQLRTVFNNDIGEAAGIIRLHFHDCMVQGCDGSVLLDGSASGPSEKSAIPNLTLRANVFKIINDLQASVQRACGQQVVSCSDIIALASRDAVFLSGGPDHQVPLGRKDGTTFATPEDTLNNLFPPNADANFMIDMFALKNLTIDDLVALLGAHTVGDGHCASFEDRLFPTVDPNMDPTFASDLKVVCPVTNSTNKTALDVRTPNAFDNQYYVDVVNRQGLFIADQALFMDNRTKSLIEGFAANQTLFFEKFVFSIIKMSQLGVFTGTQGEVRANCSLRNPASTTASLSSIVNEGNNVASL